MTLCSHSRPSLWPASWEAPRGQTWVGQGQGLLHSEPGMGRPTGSGPVGLGGAQAGTGHGEEP